MASVKLLPESDVETPDEEAHRHVPHPGESDSEHEPVDQPALKLLTNKEVPSWYSQTNIHTGYRPVNHSVAFCFRSLTYVHNETINIYTHLIPAVAALTLAILASRYLQLFLPLATPWDRLVVEINLATAVVCFATSALYHTLLCHSHHYFHLWVRIDYATILLQILGSFISGIYVGFYCEPELQRLYWSMIGMLVVLTAFVVMSPQLQSPRFRLLRTATFVTTGLSGLAPIIHAVSIFPYAQADHQAGLRYYYAEGVLVLLGAVHFSTNFPESRWPGKFDVFGASHQIFHVLVTISSVVHLYGVLSALRWNHEHPRCVNPGMVLQ